MTANLLLLLLIRGFIIERKKREHIPLKRCGSGGCSARCLSLKSPPNDSVDLRFYVAFNGRRARADVDADAMMRERSAIKSGSLLGNPTMTWDRNRPIEYEVITETSSDKTATLVVWWKFQFTLAVGGACRRKFMNFGRLFPPIDFRFRIFRLRPRPEINKHCKHNESFVCSCNLSLNIPVTWDHCKQLFAFALRNNFPNAPSCQRCTPSARCLCLHTHTHDSRSRKKIFFRLQGKRRSNRDDWEFIFQSITICNGGDGEKEACRRWRKFVEICVYTWYIMQQQAATFTSHDSLQCMFMCDKLVSLKIAMSR